jgi:outer membrane lipoprotein carrier protein
MAHALAALVVGLALAASASADGAAAPAACVDGAIEALERRYGALSDLHARFEQTTRSVALGASAGATQSASGSVWFAKPGRMRWAYDEPEPSLVVSDGETLWIYDPREREVQRLPVGEGFLSGAAIQFLLGEGEIRRSFRVEAEACDATAAQLTLLPREPASYERLGIRADPRSGDVLETRIVDLLGNETRVRFSGIEANRKPSAGVFQFEVPEGVRVIEVAPFSPDAAGGRE